MTIINKKFIELYPTYKDWQNLVEKPALAMFQTGSEIIDEATQFIPFPQLYQALANQYYSRICRYEDNEQSMRMTNCFADELVNLWIKTRPYISNQLADLKEIKHRGDNEFITDVTAESETNKIDATATNSGSGSTATSTQPFNSSGIQLTNEDNLSSKTGTITSATAGNTATSTLGRSRNLNRNQNKYNIIEDIMKVVHSRLSLEIRYFVDRFFDLFQVINAVKNCPFSLPVWQEQTLGMLSKDLQKLFIQGPGVVIEFITMDDGTPRIKFSVKTGTKDIEYKGSGLPWNQTSLFLTKLDVAGTGWIICGAEISNGTTDGVIICPPSNYYQDANYNLIIKGDFKYSVNVWQDEAKTQIYRNYQIDINTSYITTSGTVVEVTDQTEGIDWVVTNCFKYNGKVYAMLWYIPYQNNLNPGLTWNRVTIQSNTPFTEITAIKEV